MGCFTSIRHPVDGREIQIKTGDDVCAWLNIGDKIDWSPTEWNIDRHIDDIYDGSCWDNKPDCWVVIKNQCVAHAEDKVFGGFTHNDPRADTLTEDEVDALYEQDWAQKQALIDRFEIRQVNPDLWPERWREADRKRKEKWDQERAEMIAKDRAAGIDTTTFGYAMSLPIRRNIDYAGIARRALIIDPLPDGAAPVYDKPTINTKDALKKIVDFIRGTENE